MQLVSRYDLADDLVEVQQWAHGFAVDAIRPGAARNDQERLQPLDVLKSAFEVGLLTLAIPSEYGGSSPAAASRPIAAFVPTTLRVACTPASAHTSSACRRCITASSITSSTLRPASSHLGSPLVVHRCRHS